MRIPCGTTIDHDGEGPSERAVGVPIGVRLADSCSWRHAGVAGAVIMRRVARLAVDSQVAGGAAGGLIATAITTEKVSAAVSGGFDQPFRRRDGSGSLAGSGRRYGPSPLGTGYRGA